ncbi:hypothetical protein GE09DRAFT_1023414 [Coniochaeta sp. 2T2.1]|nr:hypothetical protein GE09DRAFT_1023414 [Coniochaeta sp. 2T2.1]
MSLSTTIRLVFLLFAAAVLAGSSPSRPHPSIPLVNNCTVESQPNPLLKEHLKDVTGTINMTHLIIPAPLKEIRRIVPAKWGILEHAYRALLPDFPKGHYPVLVQGGLDHDVGIAALGIQIPDFSRISFQFPFIDLLGDNHTSFNWNPSLLVSADNQVAIVGAADYGQKVYPVHFTPECNAYRGRDDGSTYLWGFSNATGPAVWVNLEMRPMFKHGDGKPVPKYPFAVFQNITNQPIFGNGTVCDNQVKLFNTSLSKGQYAPKPVEATVLGNLPPFGGLHGAGKTVWEAEGWQVDMPFVEYNGIVCSTLRGYNGPRSGD